MRLSALPHHQWAVLMAGRYLGFRDACLNSARAAQTESERALYMDLVRSCRKQAIGHLRQACEPKRDWLHRAIERELSQMASDWHARVRDPFFGRDL